jgi:hypothetical protein
VYWDVLIVAMVAHVINVLQDIIWSSAISNKLQTLTCGVHATKFVFFQTSVQLEPIQIVIFNNVKHALQVVLYVIIQDNAQHNVLLHV